MTLKLCQIKFSGFLLGTFPLVRVEKQHLGRHRTLELSRLMKLYCRQHMLKARWSRLRWKFDRLSHCKSNKGRSLTLTGRSPIFNKDQCQFISAQAVEPQMWLKRLTLNWCIKLLMYGTDSVFLLYHMYILTSPPSHTATEAVCSSPLIWTTGVSAPYRRHEIGHRTRCTSKRSQVCWV